MIVKPNDMDFSNKNIIMIISGLPGVGKTTLALSAPDVLLIDTDNGLCRVKPEHRKDASACKTYKEILEDIKAAKGHYKTIAIDTCGSLIDMMKKWAIETDPKASKNSGGISLQGYGVVKEEFLRLSNELRKDFNVIFIFHEQMEKNNEEVYYSILCDGSAKNLAYLPCDLAGHCFIMNGKRYLGFTPTEHYTAKGAYGIHGLIEVPELKNEKNVFLTKLFEIVRSNLAKEVETNNADKEKYDEIMREGLALIDTVKKPEDIENVVSIINQVEHILTSKTELKSALVNKMNALGIVKNKTTKKYEFKAD